VAQDASLLSDRASGATHVDVEVGKKKARFAAVGERRPRSDRTALEGRVVDDVAKIRDMATTIRRAGPQTAQRRRSATATEGVPTPTRGAWRGAGAEQVKPENG
jgi:hypothetical protein